MKYIVCALIGVLLFIGCEESTTGIQNERGDLRYFPVEDTCRWTYEVTRENVNPGARSAAAWIDTVTYRMFLTGGTYRNRELYSYAHPAGVSFAIYPEDDALYSLEWAGISDTIPHLFWKRHFAPQEEWDAIGLYGGGQVFGLLSAPGPVFYVTIHNKLIDESASIRIGENYFRRCIVVRSDYPALVSHLTYSSYYVRDVGLVYVKGISESMFGDVAFEYKLLSYEK